MRKVGNVLTTFAAIVGYIVIGYVVAISFLVIKESNSKN